MDQGPPGHRYTTFWEEKRVVTICFILAFAQFQYGYDSAAISGFQSMVGFLQVFGYADVLPFRIRRVDDSLHCRWDIISLRRCNNLYNR